MKTRIADAFLVITLLGLPLFGVFQACGNDGPVAPGSPGESPPPDNHAPVAVLSVVGPEEGPTPFTVQLDGSASYDPDDDPLEYLWLFSDGDYASESVTEHEFISSGRYEVRLVVSDPWDLSDEDGPVTLYSWGLANSAWPKFAHDERNSGVSQNEGPMMDLEHAPEGGAFQRYWRTGVVDDLIYGVCVGYEGTVIYTQGIWLRARTPDGAFLWEWEAESTITAWPAIAHDGSIIVGTMEGWMHRVDAEGNVMWSTDVSSKIGYPFILRTAVNIAGNGNIYFGGFKDGPVDDEIYRLLAALSLDGSVLWWHAFPYHPPLGSPENPMACERAVPAITPSGEIVINGDKGRIFSPDGTLMAELSQWTCGPPSVSSDGYIAFTNPGCSIYLPNGSFYMDLFGDSISWGDPIYGNTGGVQAPLWGAEGVSLVLPVYPDLDELFLVTRTTEGQMHKLYLYTNPDYLPGGHRTADVIAGSAEDSLGRQYISCFGLRAISPVSYETLYPYSVNRYSLWTYSRETHFMTAPVIGEDGWLYLGYGTDILAIGD